MIKLNEMNSSKNSKEESEKLNDESKREKVETDQKSNSPIPKASTNDEEEDDSAKTIGEVFLKWMDMSTGE